ncbi:MAG: SpoIVB peptidase S55 domain-containing protein [Bacillota bacterium]
MRKQTYILLIAAIILVFVNPVQGTEIMSLDEVKTGMDGRGLTVFKGTEVSEFPFEVIDIIEDSGLDEDLILVKTGGEKIKEVGGIASGMSGSPLYVDDKLIGAIAFGWEDGDSEYALATPIEKMMDLMEEADKKETNEIDIEFEDLKTPLMVSGLKGRALDNLKDDLSHFDFKVYPGSNLEEESESKELRPGSAVAVQLVRGDINVSSIGTLTYVNDDKILAFGHPFTNRGEVSYLLSRAKINETIPSQSQPFKLGGPVGEPEGMVSVDRGAGVAGNLSQFPDIIPVNITVRDRDRDKEKNINVQMIKDEKFLTSLGSNIALQSLDSVLDRVGKGTAWSEINLTGSGLPDMKVSRKNMFYSRDDIAASSLQDFYQLLDIISSNPFRRVNLMNVRMEIEVEKSDKLALVKEAEVLNEEIHPGDELDLEVSIQPYRGDPYKKVVSIELPEDMETGMSNLVISGGYLAYTGQESYEPAEDMSEEQRQVQTSSYTSLEEMLEDYKSIPQNNELMVQVYPGYQEAQPVNDIPEEEDEDMENNPEQDVPEEPEEVKPEGEEAEGEGTRPEIRETYSTDYVLEGSLNLNVEIENGEEKEREDDVESD